MTDIPEGQFTRFYPIRFANPKWTRQPTAALGFPPEFDAAVGIIALNWGNLENHINLHLSAFLQHSKKLESEAGWDKASFRVRRKLLRKTVIQILSMRPHLKKWYLDTIDESATTGNLRNLILHGKTAVKITIVPEPEKLKIEMFAEGRLNGNVVQRCLTLDDIEKLGCDILHLIGRFSVLENAFDVPLPSSDISFVRGLLSKAPESHRSIVPTLSDPP